MSGDMAIRPCEHQVGGHMEKDTTPQSMVDSAGSFYKPYQAGSRGEREAAFYRLIWEETPVKEASLLPEEAPKSAHPPPIPAATPGDGDTPLPPGVWGVGVMYGPGQGLSPRSEDVQSLRPFVPRFLGTMEINGGQFLKLSDACSIYKQPCVLDAKVGFTTLYDWGDEKYQLKCKTKDAATTQHCSGFRISGLQVYKQKEKVVEKVPRSWGRELTQDRITSPFTMFAENGSFTPQDLYGPSSPLMKALQDLHAWFTTQKSFQFFQASVLLTYEGEATTMEEAKPQVHLIDFAHTFPSAGEQDANFLRGLTSLLTILTDIGKADAPVA